MEELPIAIPWYREQDWDSVLDLFEDLRSLVPASYEAWRANAESAVERLERLPGRRPVLVVVEPEAFRAFCKARGLVPGHETRAAFCEELARELAAPASGPEPRTG